VREFARNEIAPRAEHYNRSAESPCHDAASSGRCMTPRSPRSGKGRTEPADRSSIAALSSNDERRNRLFRALRGELVAKRGIGARRRERLLIRIDPEVERHQGLVVIAPVLF
jgi:hypothetical protein